MDVIAHDLAVPPDANRLADRRAVEEDRDGALRRARVLALNPAAAAVWDLLDGRREPAELAAILAGAAGIPPAQAEADVRALLLRLGSEGFLSEEERGSSP